MERVTHITLSTLFLVLIMAGILFSGCVQENQGQASDTQVPDMNSTAIAIALNDTHLKTYLAEDGSYDILYAGPTTFETDHTSMKVTGVEIDTPYDLYYVDVDVGNGSVVYIWSQPKRAPIPQEEQ